MSARETLVLTRADVAALMRPADWLEAVETAFGAAREGGAFSPMPMHIPAEGGGFHAKGAKLSLGRTYVALKLNANFPGNPDRLGLPTIQGAILLCDGESGELLAIMDSIEVTLRRTAAASALAARHLARRDSETILICGCGEQGAAQLEALRDVLPLRRCFAWDIDPRRSEAFAARAEGLEVQPVADLAPASRQSDVIVACTTARSPYLHRELVRTGTFIAAVGADSPEKNEVAAGLLGQALVVADILEQCAEMGDLHHALRAGTMTRDQVQAELADIVSGLKPGRTHDDQITLFDSTGTALQDVASAALVYERALTGSPRLSIQLGGA